MSARLRLTVWVLLVMALMVSACDNGPSGPDKPSPPVATAVASVVVDSNSLALVVGESKQVVATPKDGNGNQLPRPVSWSSSDSEVATVSEAGLVTGVSSGNATITASSGGKSGTVTVTVNPAEPVFEFDAQVSAADRQIVRDGVGFANEFFEAKLGRRVEMPVRAKMVFAVSDRGVIADAGYKDKIYTLTFYTLSAGWKAAGSTYKLETAIHENFHAWQDDQEMWNHVIPSWFIEGTAEFVSYKALESRGLYPSYEDEKVCMAWSARSAPSLKEMSEPKDSFRSHPKIPAYRLAALAVGYLLEDKGIGALADFNKAGHANWDTAFESWSGTTKDSFYTGFELWRNELAEQGSEDRC